MCSAPPKKLLFIVNVDWFFVSHRLPIAVAAIQQGYEVHIICAITDKREYLERLGLIVHPINLSRSGVSVLSELKVFNRLYKSVKQIRPTVIHSVTIKPVLYAGVVGRLLGVRKRVSSISGLGYVFIARGFKAAVFRKAITLVYKAALKKSHAVIFQNNSDRNVLRSIGATKESQEVIIKGSGVDLSKYKVREEPVGVPVIMFVARFLVDKGIVEFIDAGQILRSKGKNFRLVLVGDIDEGNPKSISKEMLEDWVNGGAAEYWGYMQDISSVMAESNVVVLPSYREGLPKTLIEAAASARAVITTDVPGCRDAIIPNKTGVLVPVKNVKELANAIEKLLDDTTFRNDLGINGRKFAEKTFDIKDVVKTHLKIYEE